MIRRKVNTASLKSLSLGVQCGAMVHWRWHVAPPFGLREDKQAESDSCQKSADSPVDINLHKSLMASPRHHGRTFLPVLLTTIVVTIVVLLSS